MSMKEKEYFQTAAEKNLKKLKEFKEFNQGFMGIC